MVTTRVTIAKVTSAGIRLLSYFFLRWALLPLIPAVVFALLAVYVPCNVGGYLGAEETQDVDKPVDSKVAKGDVTLPVRPRKESALRNLLTGAPSPRSLLLTAGNLLINTLLVGFVADRLFSEHLMTVDDLSFVRVGYVSKDEAKLLIREPDQSRMPVSIQIHVKDGQSPLEQLSEATVPILGPDLREMTVARKTVKGSQSHLTSLRWQPAGKVQSTSSETDYTAFVTIPLRHHKLRTYEWRSSNNHSGQFTIPPQAGQASDLDGTGKFTFLSTSCIVNRLPYNPFDHPLSIPGMRYLAKLLPSLDAQFMLFLGDFIYADVPRWWGREVADYRQKYRQVYAAPEWPLVGSNLSWIHVLDDHEISNDWDLNTTGVYQAAVEPWHHYHTAVNPPLARRAGAATARSSATYFEFAQGPASFFLLDTRTHRSRNKLPSSSQNKSMLGPGQLEDFLAFLKKPEPRGVMWKIVASSVPFTKNWRVNTRDTWGGFLTERQRILEAMWDAGAMGYGVVVLSGDRHEFAATKFPPPPNSTWPESAAVYEFSASPLSQFYSPIPSYKQTDDADVKIKYINKGNSKFGAITIENLAESGQSSLKYRLFVDGVQTWNTVILSPPVVVQKPGFWKKLFGL